MLHVDWSLYKKINDINFSKKTAWKNFKLWSTVKQKDYFLNKMLSPLIY